mgnify:FL=1
MKQCTLLRIRYQHKHKHKYKYKNVTQKSEKLYLSWIDENKFYRI